jgi:hypothetical protein
VSAGLVLAWDATTAMADSSTWPDQSGANNTGLLVNAPVLNAPGHLAALAARPYYWFNGTSKQNVQTAQSYDNPTTFSLGVAFAMEEDIRPEVGPGTWFGQKLIGFESALTGASASVLQFDRLLYIGTDGGVHFGVNSNLNSGTGQVTIGSTLSPFYNKWHYVVATLNGAQHACHVSLMLAQWHRTHFSVPWVAFSCHNLWFCFFGMVCSSLFLCVFLSFCFCFVCSP